MKNQVPERDLVLNAVKHMFLVQINKENNSGKLATADLDHIWFGLRRDLKNKKNYA